jgi:hypothetical protein
MGSASAGLQVANQVGVVASFHASYAVAAAVAAVGVAAALGIRSLARRPGDQPAAAGDRLEAGGVDLRPAPAAVEAAPAAGG